MTQVMAAVVKTLVKHCKSKYDDRFEFFYTGGYARNERDITDYDIAIYDNNNNQDDWEDVLKVFHNKKEHDDAPIDAQIDQMFKVVSKMSGNTIYENRDWDAVFLFSETSSVQKDAWKYIPKKFKYDKVDTEVINSVNFKSAIDKLNQMKERKQENE